MQVGTYPTRNFALVGPHVAVRLGPSLHLELSQRDGWRMASEDSRTRHGYYTVTSGLSSGVEVDNPLHASRPFLLIVRTGRIFTHHATTREGL